MGNFRNFKFKMKKSEITRRESRFMDSGISHNTAFFSEDEDEVKVLSSYSEDESEYEMESDGNPLRRYWLICNFLRLKFGVLKTVQMTTKE